jgi:exodeoxyribonuclease-3
MRIITANLNGIRSAQKKGFFDWMATTNADVVCVQELKAQQADLTDEMSAPGDYKGHFSYAEEKGYSGVGVYAKQSPISLRHTLDHPIFDTEGRYV